MLWTQSKFLKALWKNGYSQRRVLTCGSLNRTMAIVQVRLELPTDCIRRISLYINPNIAQTVLHRYAAQMTQQTATQRNLFHTRNLYAWVPYPTDVKAAK